MDKSNPAPGAAPFGLALFLASLGVLFAASIVAYYAVRVPAGEAWGLGLPPLPVLLWASTAVLLLSSVTMHGALRGVRLGLDSHLRGGLYLTAALGTLFLILQVVAWQLLYERAGAPAVKTLYGMTFYFLTGIHGLHVVGGLVPLAITTYKARVGAYSLGEHTGVLMCSMYWHFLDVIWLILFSVLVLVG
ncbi:MAG: heme-copper oxidase subunit III [Planctomycetes bacterium]|nr:heme-copper oxidase subunit III [Planctomycetota bacterium]